MWEGLGAGGGAKAEDGLGVMFSEHLLSIRQIDVRIQDPLRLRAGWQGSWFPERSVGAVSRDWDISSG